MRRLSAGIVLALFLGTPLLQLQCAIACAMEEVSESADACHHQHATALEGLPALEGHHDCGEHATPAAILSTNRGLNLDALPSASVAPAMTVATETAALSPVALGPPGGPPSGLVVPLRL